MVASLIESRTLVVDDFEPMHTLLAGFLKSTGIKKIEHAYNAKEALSLLGSKKYDIVLCDYNLGPGKNWMQILEEAKLRKFVGYSTIWIMVTAEKTMDMFMGAADTKPDDYLLKPVNEKILETRLNKTLEKKQSFIAIEKAMNEHNYIGAISLCDEQIKSQSKNTTDLLRLKGELLISIGEFAAAKELYMEVLAARSVPWAKVGLGRVYYLTNEFFKAKEILEEVLNANRMYLEAADWLAKTSEVLGDTKKSQQILLDATEISPLSSIRQKTLADTAHSNADLELAKTTYEKVIKLDEHSFLKSPDAYAGLAKVLVDKNSPGEALRVLDGCRKEFKNNPKAELNTALVQSMVFKRMGRHEEARSAIKEAKSLMDALPERADTKTTIDVAKALLQLGEKEEASALFGEVIKNNHENKSIANQIEAVFEGAGLSAEGGYLIKNSIKEVVDINNQGVLLAREGKFNEGIELLRKALSQLQYNTQFMINLCGMLIGLMRKEGKEDRLIYETRELLERVRKIDPTNKKYREYTTVLNQM